MKKVALLLVALCSGVIFAQVINVTNLRIGIVTPAPPTESFVFALTSDVHVGRPNTFSEGEPMTNFHYMINTQGARFVIATGDIADQSGVTQTTYMVTTTNLFPTVPFWITPGNHDACGNCGSDTIPSGTCDSGIDPCDESYTNFVAQLNSGSTNMHWIHDYGSSLRFIGFNSLEIRSGGLNGFGKVEDWEYDWLTNAIAQSAAAGKKTALCTHFPLLDTWGNNIKTHQTELINAMNSAGNVVAYLCGHRHGWGAHETNNGTIHVSIPGLSYSQSDSDPPYSGNGGYFMVTVTNRQMNFRLWASAAPTYTMRDTNFFIPY